MVIVSVLQDGKVLEIGCMIMGICLTLLNCILRNCSDGKFYVMHLYHNKNCLLK